MALVEVRGLGKRFKYYPNPRRRLMEWLCTRVPQHDERWVLRDISFSINKGESIAFVGRNGAGKSTLLKLITGTLLPTEGSVRIAGRISALLELGMGFHPDFTGRKNVLLTGQLLGLSRQEIAQALPAIEAFAEIGEAIDHPVRTYSSGMQVRLAFSLATVIEPDILVVDEALAVGDAYFQHKCFRRIRELREQGVTLVFVSHDPLAVKSLCNRAILLEQGRVVMDDAPDLVMDYYNALIAIDETRQAKHDEAIVQTDGITRSGQGCARITQVNLVSADGPTLAIESGARARFDVWFQLRDPLTDLTVGILIKDRLGNEIFGTNTHNLGIALPNLSLAHSHLISFHIPRLDLGPGSYSLTVALHASYNHLAGNYDWLDQALTFRVTADQAYPFVGVSRLQVRCEHSASPPTPLGIKQDIHS